MAAKEDTERLREAIEEFNRRALSENLRADEIAQIRKLLPQIEDALVVHNRAKWIVRSIGAALLAIPAIMALWQAIMKIVEWAKG